MVDKPIFRGYTEPELRAAFEKVENKNNWKLGNEVLINESEFDVTNAAVIFFTGSGLDFDYAIKEDDETIKFHVKFAGYYKAIGA